MQKRKSSKKTPPAKKAPHQKPRPIGKTLTEADITRSAYFREAALTAEAYANDPGRLRNLFEQASHKIRDMPRGPFADMWAYLLAMIRLIRAYHTGAYREIPERSFLIVISAMIYFVSPLDVIPDWIPILGYIDDALVVGLALKTVRDDLDAFMEWETAEV
jgi:uncharacterized membrane protein YkvA (DUF1232 family)